MDAVTNLRASAPFEHELELMRRLKPPLPELEDQLLYDRAGLRIGVFRAYPDDRHFRCSGEPGEHLIVFPETSVWIRHRGATRFVADRNVATLYNPDDTYERAPLSLYGDHGHWFAFPRETLCEALGPEARATDDSLVLRWQAVKTTNQIYRRQTTIVARLGEDPTDDLAIQSDALALLDDLASQLPGTSTTKISNDHRRLAERARAILAQRYREALPLKTLADELGCSQYHLCRVFKRVVGTTVHRYLTNLRLRRSLHEIPEGSRLVDLAFELGFSSHSHFTQAFRSAFDVTPAAYRGGVAISE